MIQTTNHRGIAAAPESKMQFVPVINIPVMSPEKEKNLVEKQKERHPEWYAEYYARTRKV